MRKKKLERKRRKNRFQLFKVTFSLHLQKERAGERERESTPIFQKISPPPFLSRIFDSELNRKETYGGNSLFPGSFLFATHKHFPLMHGKRTRYSRFFFADPLLAAPLHIILVYRPSPLYESNNFSFSPQGAGDKNCTPCQSQFIMSDDDPPPPLSSPHICQRRGGEGKRKRVSEKFCPHATTLYLPSCIMAVHTADVTFPNNMSIGGESDI